MLMLCVGAAAVHSAHQTSLRSHQSPEGTVDGVAKGEIPTAGEAVGQQTGVDVPNPHQYTGAIVGGGLAGTFVTLAIFCVATYMVYKWNTDMKEKGQEYLGPWIHGSG